jgi:hypothetical protein
VYSVVFDEDTQCYTRTMSDGYTTMSVTEEDFGKKLSHTALKVFVRDPADKGVTVTRSWPKEVYRVNKM